jgi:UDPglucose--hexose-1-phosphate uridylyltransferase
MPEFRQNLATREWVIISRERAKRPEQFKVRTERPELPSHDGSCPFCPGNEDRTPEPSLVVPASGSWMTRVVPNRFAALDAGLSPERHRMGRYLFAEGYGIAEVVIESPRHDLSPATMRDRSVAQVLDCFAERYRAMAHRPAINLITIFRNHGPLAGTSLEHPHSQIIATPIVPPHVQDPINLARAYFNNEGRCVFCDMASEEGEVRVRIVEETESFLCFVPYAARSPFETRIYPKRHSASFWGTTPEERVELGGVLRRALGRLHGSLNNPDYNFIIRSAPIGDEDVRFYHWYIVIVPKVTTPAGFELGAGIYINITVPEECAAVLRDTEPVEVRESE